ncbi:MAG: hypothetical protein ABIA21_03785 [Candidatus Aenigmatarchaeota archaeon]
MSKYLVFTIFVFTILVAILMGSSSTASAEMCGDYDCDELKIMDPGLTPDSPFYFLDEFFDGFSNEIEVREEKIAEIKSMIELENYEAAEKALNNYLKYSELAEKEADPENKEKIKKSTEVIRNELEKMKDKIPEEQREIIIKRERQLVTAVEISNKIKELCRELAEMDPIQYGKICVANESNSRWQKTLDKELTDEQKKEAKEFGDILSECFETSGQTCRCDDISFLEFSNICKKVAPLTVECDIYKDQNACQQLDELVLPSLPEHLQLELDSKIRLSQYELHMPKECVAKRVQTPEECRKLMISENSPKECRDELLKADVQSEEEGKKLCDQVMMELYSPECVEQGIKNPEECQDYLFDIDHRPRECMESGIHDAKDCKDFLDSVGKYEGSGYKETSAKKGVIKINSNCKDIVDPMERLKCYDAATNQLEGMKGIDDQDYSGPCMTEQDWAMKKAECRSLYGPQAGDEPIMGDSTQGYECIVDARCIDFSYKEDYDAPPECKKVNALSKEACKQHMDDVSKIGVKCDNCISTCPDNEGQRLRGTGCGKNGCECYYENDDSEKSGGGDTGGESGTNCIDCQSTCSPQTGKRLRGTGCGENGCECYYEDVSSGDSGESDSGSDTIEDQNPVEEVDTGNKGGDVIGGDTGGDSGDQGVSDSISSDTGSSDSGSSGGGETTIPGDETSSDDISNSGNEVTGMIVADSFLDYWYTRG